MAVQEISHQREDSIKTPYSTSVDKNREPNFWGIKYISNPGYDALRESYTVLVVVYNIFTPNNFRDQTRRQIYPFRGE